jgi:DNA-binding winged helix-turn-helix (wHTH) protein
MNPATPNCWRNGHETFAGAFGTEAVRQAGISLLNRTRKATVRIQLVNGLETQVSDLRRVLEAGGFRVVETSGKGAQAVSPAVEDVCCRLDFESTVAGSSRPSEESRVVIGQVVLSIATGSNRMLAAGTGRSNSPDKKAVGRVRDLIGRLCCLLHSAAPESRAVIQVHDLEIDVSARRVYRSGQEIWLTRLEFDILEFLARNRGQLVSASRIRDYLYKDRKEARSNTISVFIGFLRRKIDRDFSPPLILTRWNQGYMLRAPESAA